METKNLFHHFRPKTRLNRIGLQSEEAILAAGDVWRRSKQMTLLLDHLLVSSCMTGGGEKVDGNYWCGYMVVKHGFKQVKTPLGPLLNFIFLMIATAAAGNRSILN